MLFYFLYGVGMLWAAKWSATHGPCVHPRELPCPTYLLFLTFPNACCIGSIKQGCVPPFYTTFQKKRNSMHFCIYHLIPALRVHAHPDLKCIFISSCTSITKVFQVYFVTFCEGEHCPCHYSTSMLFPWNRGIMTTRCGTNP